MLKILWVVSKSRCSSKLCASKMNGTRIYKQKALGRQRWRARYTLKITMDGRKIIPRNDALKVVSVLPNLRPSKGGKVF